MAFLKTDMKFYTLAPMILLMKTMIISVIALIIQIYPIVSYARSVTDDTGKTMNIPDNPQRIAAFAPSITEIVFSLGQGHKLVGVTAFSDFPPEAKKIPQIGTHINLELEKIVSLNPDLCIGIKDGDTSSTLQRLNALKFPVYIVDPKNFDTVMKSISDIGALLNCPDIAASLVRDMSARIHAVKTKISKADHRPGVFFQIGIEPIVSAGTPTFINELIEIAGGRNLAAGSVAYPRFSKEKILFMKPDIIFITSMAREGRFEEVKAQWSVWDQLPAVKNRRIFIIDSDIVDRPTFRLVSGLEAIAALIHPELFGKTE